MKVKIQITRWHLEEGIRYSCSRCPVALAISSVTFPRYSVLVHRDFIIVRNPWALGIAVFPIPDRVKKFIRAFDHGQAMQPTVMELDIPDHITGVFLV
jgi:hypothetical protein